MKAVNTTYLGTLLVSLLAVLCIVGCTSWPERPRAALEPRALDDLDGGIASLLPVRFARAMGADVVIAVDIYCTGPQNEGLAAPAVLLRVMRIQSCLVAAPEMAEADFLIAPPVSVPGMSAKHEQERAIQAGYEATMAVLPSIKSQLSRTTGA